ncbi:hypothetical protein OUO20_09685 [Arthrobacter sp. FX8]|uniref:hypothetical protein n=1 Tax=Arthrobacter sp. FX8 TaxID=2997335 RepID=UPI00227D20F5|nr:hypothetical protein [Arthrobacter sp. FX8]WAJ35070.1 hypothetical protein OUO20_09685 [Arthrobacter sp. FX8]
MYFSLPFMVVSLILNFLPFDALPWQVAKAVFLLIGAVVLGIWVTRFSLWQRDEYWRERGKDPKHPERLPNHTAD